ncbi:hypothetical protein E9549_19260 [Blastococcus sp. MG754426]|uniref:hypothetical protein n=1 Tax=unclassified Blastococcus TaxID=2619396 RepID=UPI001EF07FBC|nr:MULTISPECIES: hypothetical protein [unclassified Blastococcus]MCF6509523.1 hypothetical protein [Blastococcus sp. MG754426]MCF6512161.1 hypothetical protein [Blastococcus sp. MG754427]
MSAGVIAWQSWETRKNARAAGEAARAANEALDLARSQEGHTRTLIAEAIRTRIDAKTPTLTLRPEPPIWPPVRRLADNLRPDEALPPGTAFTMPRDREIPILVRQPLTVHNATDQPMDLTANLPLYDRESRGLIGQQITVPGRYSLRVYHVIQQTLGEWVASAELREKGEPGLEWRLQFNYVDQADTGAMDTYEVATGGLPIERVPQELGNWRIAKLRLEGSAFDVIDSSVLPRRRRYWLSRTRNQELE